MKFSKGHAVGVAAAYAVFLAICAPAVAQQDQIAAMISRLDPSNSFKVRVQAAILLGRAGDKRAIAPLIECLKDEDFIIRGSAVIALGNIGDPSASQAIVGALKDNEELVRTEARNSLIKLSRNPETVKAILGAFQGGDIRVRGGMLAVLGALKDDEAVGALASALGDPGPGGISDAAVIVVAELGKDKASKVLNKALDSQVVAARMKAIDVIGRLKYQEFIGRLASIMVTDTSGQEARAARDALMKMRQFINSSQLAALAKGQDKAWRDKAIMLLGISGDETGFRTLMDLLQDPDVYIRGRAAQALVVAGDKRAIPKLEKMLRDKGNERIAEILLNSLKVLRRSE
ncbi:MAG: HEAT repeat domain-containing protein [Myxococcota bacterium]|jgi:HEAT repeat protein